MRTLFLICLLFFKFPFACLFFAEAFAQQYEQGGITLSHVWARATPMGSKVGVAYLQITVKKGSPDTLLSVTSPLATKVEVHTHTEKDGIFRMRHIEKLPLAEGKKIVFEPSGLHLMLFDLKEQMKEGEKFPLILQFEKAGLMKVEATIEAIGSQGGAKKENN